MEQGFGEGGKNSASGEGVIRPGGTIHPDKYDATSDGPVSGFASLANHAGAVGSDMTSGDHFSGEATGASGSSAGTFKQV